MSKRSTEETDTIEFSFDNSNEQLRKKIKLLNDKIIERIKEIDEEIDINKHEVHKFLLIFHSLFEIVTSGEIFEETEGIFNDIILVVCNIIAGLLRNNIDNLNLLEILKSALKKLKDLFVRVKEESGESKPEIKLKENAQLRVQTKEANGPVGRGGKNNDRIRVRNRSYKTKRYMLQPRNIDVRHNG